MSLQHAGKDACSQADCFGQFFLFHSLCVTTRSGR